MENYIRPKSCPGPFKINTGRSLQFQVHTILYLQMDGRGDSSIPSHPTHIKKNIHYQGYNEMISYELNKKNEIKRKACMMWLWGY